MAVWGTEKYHVKAVKEKGFRAREKAERKRWGHESKDPFDRRCQKIECCVHKKVLAQAMPIQRNRKTLRF